MSRPISYASASTASVGDAPPMTPTTVRTRTTSFAAVLQHSTEALAGLWPALRVYYREARGSVPRRGSEGNSHSARDAMPDRFATGDRQHSAGRRTRLLGIALVRFAAVVATVPYAAYVNAPARRRGRRGRQPPRARASLSADQAQRPVPVLVGRPHRPVHGRRRLLRRHLASHPHAQHRHRHRPRRRGRRRQGHRVQQGARAREPHAALRRGGRQARHQRRPAWRRAPVGARSLTTPASSPTSASSSRSTTPF